QTQPADVVDAQLPRRDALAADHPHPVFPGAVEDDRNLATRPVEVRFDDLQDEACRRRGIEGVAALLQHGHSRGAGQPVGGGDHAEGADQFRTRGYLHEDPELCEVCDAVLTGRPFWQCIGPGWKWYAISHRGRQNVRATTTACYSEAVPRFKRNQFQNGSVIGEYRPGASVSRLRGPQGRGPDPGRARTG